MTTEQIIADLGDICAEARTLEVFAATPEGREAGALLQRLCVVVLSLAEPRDLMDSMEPDFVVSGKAN